MSRRPHRSWWGWGTTEAAVDQAELDRLAGTVQLAFGAEVATSAAPAPSIPPLPAPRIREPAVDGVHVDPDPAVRWRQSHGQGFLDVAVLAEAATHADALPRPVDHVLRPDDAAAVARALDWAADAGVAVVPVGGATSVVGGVNGPTEQGPVVALDCSGLQGILELDLASDHVRLGAGMTGPQVEDALRPHGRTLRFYPQSWEFSTLGGWIATRAGGHFATGPTHIDDLTAAVAAVTPSGPWTMSRPLPGSGAGPSPDRLLLGSEGAFGVITDAWMRVRPTPVHRARVDLHAPDLVTAAHAVRDVLRAELLPSNARVLDPLEAFINGAGDGSHAVLVLAFESAARPMETDLAVAVEIARDGGCTVAAGGADAGEVAAGEAWKSSFLRAPYLRDGLVRLGMVVETFETAVTWGRFEAFAAEVVDAVGAVARDVCGEAIVTMRTTHAYRDGIAPYLTVIAPGRPGARAGQWRTIKQEASRVIAAHAGTITHHHAVGRWHAPDHRAQIPDAAFEALEAVKDRLDPDGILNPGVLGLGAHGRGVSGPDQEMHA